MVFSAAPVSPADSRTPWLPTCTPRNPFFLADGSLLLRMLEMEKFVELPVVFCVVAVFFDCVVSLASPPSSPPVLITGKQVMLRNVSDGSGVVFRLLDSGLDTTLTSIASD